MTTSKPVYGLVLAGGKSRRMGTDKALLPFLGQPLIARVLARLAPIADEIIVTTNQPEKYAFLGVSLFPDIIPERGALSGLYTALSAASHPLVAVVACDMPFVNPDLLAAQRERIVETNADIVIPQTEHGLEPLHTIYRREACLPHVEAALQAGKWRVDAWFHQVNMETFSLEAILTHDPDLRSFRNLNTPAELEAAIQLAQTMEQRG